MNTNKKSDPQQEITILMRELLETTEGNYKRALMYVKRIVRSQSKKSLHHIPYKQK